MELATNLALGIGLSAACGFRVFAPLLVLSIAGVTGQFTPAPELAWLASPAALILLGTATVVEIVAYYVPGADNLLDTIASPAALVAGVLASASVLGDFPPYLQWVLAAVAGGGAAGLVQAGTVLLRGTSSVTTGGAGNFIVATIENVLSLVTAILALIMPLIVLAVGLALGITMWRYLRRRKRTVSNPGEVSQRL
jgi:hypothetical protein